MALKKKKLYAGSFRCCVCDKVFNEGGEWRRIELDRVTHFTGVVCEACIKKGKGGEAVSW